MSRTKKPSIPALQAALLDWFDRHRRVMPWRAAKGRRPNPYHVWLSEIMLQQTTVVTVGPYFVKFTGLWPTVGDLAAAKLDDVLTAWAGLGYYARARNLHKCAQAVVGQYGGKFPADEASLLGLPGIGPYTAAAIISIAFDKPAVAVDGNVERVVSRFDGIEEPLPLSKPAIRAGAAKLADGNPRPGDFTQAMMELGATVCTPRKPRCGLCPWQNSCAARKAGNAEELPHKLPKKAKPAKTGKVYWIVNTKGQVMIQKRAEKGLYGGMYQLPTTAWREAAEKPDGHPAFVSGHGLAPIGPSVRHSFTHFDLSLEIWQGQAASAQLPVGGKWVSISALDRYALPTLMQKVARLMIGGG
ncbi:MAG: A/G-specific adenine glycosylase [Alphaproteobacteria bacterium]|nr:A/G-specific adenine glycosylase [Alphaproteobacteria bacterium]